METHHYIIAAVAVLMVCKAVQSIAAGFNAEDLMCTTCGHQGGTKTRTKGHLAIELVLWLCFIVPGLIYSIWRMSSRDEVCGSCGAATLVPADSPVAVKLRKDLNLAPAVAPGAIGPSGERLS